MRKEYRVYGCTEALDKVERGKVYVHVERCEKSEALFFGVYKIQEDGTEEWIADFLSQDDAELFALEKEKAEIK